jgi:hypothetical protein
MLVEQRLYTVAPGQLKAYLSAYQAHGLAVHTEILGHWLGCYVTEIGPLNQIVHLWGFASFEDRLERRERLAADPRWHKYLREAAGLVIQQETRLLKRAPFTPAAQALAPAIP